jgi:hypothetical protein
MPIAMSSILAINQLITVPCQTQSQVDTASDANAISS